MKGFQHYLDHASEWRWRLRDEQDLTVADSSEGYKAKSDCEKGSALFTTLGVAAPEHEGKKGGGPVWEYFQDSEGLWRWHFQAANNKIIADSGSRASTTAEATKQAIAKVRQLLKEIGGGGGGYAPPTTGGSAGPGRFA